MGLVIAVLLAILPPGQLLSNGPWCYSEVKLLGLIDRTNGLLVRKVATNPTEKA